MNDYNFGNFLCMLREGKGLTQCDIATMLGVTPAAVSKWENGSSKPRVEVLFRLAQILGVRAEELMAGHYIESEQLDPEVVKNINERYNYLSRIDSYNTPGVKFRRMLAWAIDWNICGLFTAFLLCIYLAIFHTAISAKHPLDLLGAMTIILIYYVTFILRDVIFKGRSLGKRILKLTIIDKKTGAPAKIGKCLLRNLFLIIIQIDAIFMLVSGSSIGDKAAHTAVVLNRNIVNNGENNISKINNYRAPKPVSVKKIVFITVTVVVLFIVLLVSIVLTALGSVKDNEEYKLAYDYLIHSKAFKESNTSESQIRFNSYSSHSYGNSHEHWGNRTVELGFTVNWRSYKVVCHKVDNVWNVCTDCTPFN